MAFQLVLAAVLSAAIVLLIWALRGVLLTPVPRVPDVHITVTVTAQGSASALEQTVRSLAWLRDSGTLPAQLVLRDGGMDASARQTAALLCADHGLEYEHEEREIWTKS